MVKRIFTITLFCVAAAMQARASSPKLIVVISLDQFRYDYITRFGQHFGKGGFRYFLENGANFTNASFKHAINTTGPGHAALLSGTYGNVNGIIGNDWFDRDSRKWMYCVEDRNAALIGSQGTGRSPRNFIGSTLGDELRMKYGFHAKVVSVSNKDRAAILMGGKMPNGVYWMKDSVFISSNYYANELPAWVKQFNRSGYIDSFFGKVWNKKLPDSAYRFMDDDNVPYETDQDGSGRTFPHTINGLDTTKITPSYYWSLARSPFSSEILNEFAKKAIEAENLGQRGLTDLLCVGFSAPDIVGHAYGPHSIEVMDMALRTDQILADFLSFLEKRIGLSNCVFVLSADHGVAPIPEYMKRHHPNADAGRVRVDSLKEFCSRVLTRRFGEPQNDAKWIDAIVANNIYFNRETFQQMKVPTLEWAASELADSLRTYHPIAAAYSSSQLSALAATGPVENKLKRSFHKVRSGDVVYALRPYWTESNWTAGASHGEPYEYDAHVPLVFVGAGIRKGTYAVEASPVDIAPTLSALLGIELPAGRGGRVLTEALK
ncbi:MAG: alkaline phosphatase family protein [Bacteroidetes bacterium]|nr:alkaline phosphatase family protein [Bacteroidota bacterium]MCW5897616.1 alkaline phosphatase family protein [Bacteroidota bacterium]